MVVGGYDLGGVLSCLVWKGGFCPSGLCPGGLCPVTGGKLFHSLGPVGPKALSPKVVWVLVTTHVTGSLWSTVHRNNVAMRLHSYITAILK